MDVFHKVLVKIYEEAGGKETEDVDLTSLLKREGFYSNIDTITKQLEDEGWVTQTARQYVVRITHWGRKEAQRVLSDSPDKANERERELSRMVNEAKETLIAIEELSG
ncbi:MAG TPA: hypothetical protein VNK26_08150, partial [Pyrinomonadaceae bacterium]|nr:hypothetical protein [Pyrinomonadaceae bacterium]